MEDSLGPVVLFFWAETALKTWARCLCLGKLAQNSMYIPHKKSMRLMRAGRQRIDNRRDKYRKGAWRIKIAVRLCPGQ